MPDQSGRGTSPIYGAVMELPPQTAEHPSRCDFCWRRDVIVLDVACIHEHISTVIVCRDKHEKRTRDEEGDIACKACEVDHWCILRVLGESPLPPAPRP